MTTEVYRFEIGISFRLLLVFPDVTDWAFEFPVVCSLHVSVFLFGLRFPRGTINLEVRCHSSKLKFVDFNKVSFQIKKVCRSYARTDRFLGGVSTMIYGN